MVAALDIKGREPAADGAVIYKLGMGFERAAGVAILLISSDLEEVRSLSDRIGVLYQGRIVIEKPAEAFTERELGLYMAGSSAVEQQAVGGAH